MSHWSLGLPGVVEFYFSSNLILTGLVLAAVALAASFAIFALSKNHRRRSTSMLSAMMISTSLWVFILASLLLCFGLEGEYVNSPANAVIEVAKFAILPTVILGPVIFYLLRNRAMKQIYPYFTFTRKSREESSSIESVRSRVSIVFSSLLYVSNLSGIALSVVPGASDLPASAALDWKGEKVVAISSGAAVALDDDELRAVLAHELGHIVHRDSLRKTMATAYRSAFIFDPVAHFVEAAIYRDGELYADEYSAKLTGKPAALASALIKIHETMHGTASSVPITQVASLLLNERESSIFSKQPSLTLRIKKLLEMEDHEDAADRLEEPDSTSVSR